MVADEIKVLDGDKHRHKIIYFGQGIQVSQEGDSIPETLEQLASKIEKRLDKK